MIEILITGGLSEQTKQLSSAIVDRFIRVGFYDASNHVKLWCGTRKLTCTTLEDALEHCAEHHKNKRFAHLFLFTFEEAKRILSMLFPNRI